MGEFNVDKTTGNLIPTAGMPETYPATQVMMSDGVTSVEDAVDGLAEKTDSLHIKMVQLVDADNVPTTATSYSCNWSNYDIISVSARQYGNYTHTIEVPNSYFQTTTSSRRVIAKDVATGVYFEVYKNGNNAIYIKASELSSIAAISVYGKFIGV